VPQVDVVDHTWIRSDLATLAGRIGDQRNWGRWWPDLHLRVAERRGLKGVRWNATSSDFAGTMEVYLAADHDGVLLHYFLRLDPVDGRSLSRRARVRLRRAHTQRAKLIFWQLKDEVEAAAAER
jgi:hypothetical protein